MYEKPLENHMRLFHSPDMLDPVTGGFQCKDCNKTFTLKPNLKKHVKLVHEQIKEHSCEQCGKAFGVLAQLKIHIKMVHDKIKDHQ